MNRTDAPPVMDGDGLRKAVEWAIMSLRSIRAFLSILDEARFAASGVNTQPWRVHIVTGQAQFRRNYQFFDAPVGLFFTINRIMRQGDRLVAERAETGSFTTFYAD